ncbi:MAG: hypothetical protein IJU16_05055 [Clostridia bacterium]|nr:hypothetical protein [Clostridia bacterium]
MPMKRGWILILKLLTLLLAAAVILCGLNVVYVNGFYYRDTYGEVQKFNDVPEHITMANFGTSHGLATFQYPADNGYTCFNFALSGSDIYHNYMLAKQYADHIEDGCIVAIPVSYFQFCMPLDTPTEKRYYGILDKSYIRGFSYETLINTNYLPVLRSGEYLFKDLIKDQELDVMIAQAEEIEQPAVEQPTAQEAATEDAAATTAENDGEIVSPSISGGETDLETLRARAVMTKEEQEAHIQELISHAVTRAESWRSGYLLTGQPYMEGNRDYLIEMIAFLKEKGCRVLLLTTPVYYAMNDAFTADELQTYYYEPLQAVCEATGVPYLDLSHDERFDHEPAYYSNADHTTAYGSAAFYQVYMDYLREIGYIA